MGNYLPHLIQTFKESDPERVIHPFLINGHPGVVDICCRIAYNLLQGQGDRTVFGGVCNAFDTPPSNISLFPSAQKAFMPFRMGAVGSREELSQYLKARIPLMGDSGICCLTVLADTETTRKSLQRNQERTFSGYTEFYKVLRQKFLENIKSHSTNSDFDHMRQSLENTPKHQNDPTYPAHTVFSPEGVERLIDEAGGRILDPQSLEKPFVSKTDEGKPVEVFPLVLVSKDHKV